MIAKSWNVADPEQKNLELIFSLCNSPSLSSSASALTSSDYQITPVECVLISPPASTNQKAKNAIREQMRAEAEVCLPCCKLPARMAGSSVYLVNIVDL